MKEIRHNIPLQAEVLLNASALVLVLLLGFLCVLQKATNSADKALLFPVQHHRRSCQINLVPTYLMQPVGESCLLSKSYKQNWVLHHFFILFNFQV